MEPRNMRPDDMEGRREADRINDLITRAGGIVRYLEGPRYTAKAKTTPLSFWPNLEGPRYTAKEGKEHDI